jgi:hypothetical protein
LLLRRKSLTLNPHRCELAIVDVAATCRHACNRR